MSNYAEQFNAAFGDLFAEVTKAIDELAARDGLAAKNTEKLEQELQSTKDLVKKLQAENAVLRSENASLLKLRTADFDQIQRLALENDTQQAKIHILTGQLHDATKKLTTLETPLGPMLPTPENFMKLNDALYAKEGELQVIGASFNSYLDAMLKVFDITSHKPQG